MRKILVKIKSISCILILSGCFLGFDLYGALENTRGRCQEVFSSGSDSSFDLKVERMILKILEEDIFLGSFFDMPVGVEDGYSLKEHTVYMYRHFLMYFGFMDEYFSDLMAVLSLLHDIGKPISSVLDRNDIHLQYTMSVLDSFDIKDLLVKYFGILPDQFELSRSIITGGLGDYFQAKISKEEFIRGIEEKARSTGLDKCRYFYYLTIYYQCDSGAYTHEVGAKPRLEHLFSYESENQKEFIKDQGRIKFSPRLESMYLDLKDSICK